MSQPEKSRNGAKTRLGKRGPDCQVKFYGGLKSKNELYFQMASLFKEATKGDDSLSGMWINRMMALHDSKPSGKFF